MVRLTAGSLGTSNATALLAERTGNKAASPVRVLQVVSKMDRAGAETWLIDILRRTDRDAAVCDVMVLDDEKGAYDDELRALGVRVVCCRQHRNPVRFGLEFLKLVQRLGPYDAVHTHVDLYGGVIASLARLAGIPFRIAHSHSSLPMTQGSVFRRAYVRLMQASILINATHRS